MIDLYIQMTYNYQLFFFNYEWWTEIEKTPSDLTYEDKFDIIYMWTDGNYGCDCNRSNFIRQYAPFGEDCPEMTCGSNIRLDLIEIVQEDKTKKLLYYSGNFVHYTPDGWAIGRK